MRKAKLPGLVAVQQIVSLPPSFLEYAKGLGQSRWYKEKLCEDILGTTRQGFIGHYSKGLDVREHRDPLDQEYERCARWIIESKVKSFWANKQGMVFVDVHWTITNVDTVIAMYMGRGTIDKFAKVCYDYVLDEKEAQEALAGPKLPVTDRLGTYSPMKARVLDRWLYHSGFYTYWEEGELRTTSRTISKMAIQRLNGEG